MPSGFMMNGPMWSFGAESTLKSGTSCPAHLPVDSFHHTCRRAGSQGFPVGSQDARLYMTRRFAGQDQAQFGYTPRPDGSSVPRRCDIAPASVHEPLYSQLPQSVVPSSFSAAKPGSCCPALIVFPLAGSTTSASARPLISFASSTNDRWSGSV